jgi:glutamate/tyrosine decarboxylase-like PLP-dependent enzyme
MNLVDKFKSYLERAVDANKYALGYPVNREHAFKIDLSLLGILDNSLATTYLNNIASPYSHGKYTSDNLKELEVELIKNLANHFNLSEDESFGYVTYGGTEANFASLWWHRNFLEKQTGVRPIVMTSSRSHYWVKKAADQLGMELVTIDADYSGIHYEHIENIIKYINQPIIFSANFGATTDGSIDDIFRIHSILSKRSIPFKIHGDGAIYGPVIPYLKQYKLINCIFDYIDTLVFSGHKLLGSYSICGVVLTKRSYIKQVFNEESKKISFLDVIDITVSGSRQGFFVAELYLLISEALSIENNQTKLQILWTKCVEVAEWFYNELSNIIPQSHIHYNQGQLSIILPAPSKQSNKDFLGKKYGLMSIDDDKFGIYIFPRSTKTKLNMFIDDYRKLI